MRLGRRRPIAVRTILYVLAAGAGLYVAALGTYVAIDLAPAAASLRVSAGALALEYDSLRIQTGTLQHALDQVRRLVAAPAPGGEAAAEARTLRSEIEAIASQSAGVKASLILTDIPVGMRGALGDAAGLESRVAGMLLEALEDVGAGDRVAATGWVVRAEAARTSLAAQLGDAERQGLLDLSSREQVLSDRAARVGQAIAAWVVLGIGLLAAGLLVFHRRLYRPLKQLDRGLARVAQGDFRTSLPVGRDDEMGRLLAHFNEMTRELEAHPEVEALRRERYLVDTLMEHVPDFIYFKDAESRFLRINRAAAYRFGVRDPAAAVGKTDFDFFAREHAIAALKDEQEIIRTGRPVVSLEEQETWPDRPSAWVSTTKMPMRDEAGNITGTFGISRDITERKEAQLALEKSRESFARIFSLAPVAISISGLDDGRYLDVNEEYVRLLGYSREELIGHTSVELGVWPDRARREELVRVVREKGEVRDHELRLRSRDGRERTVRGAFQKMELEGRPILLATFTDITERRQARRMLEESEARFRTAFMTMSDSHYIATRDEGRILEVNDRFESAFGWPRAEVLGRTSLELGLYPRPEDRAAMLAELAAGGQVRDLETVGRRRNGETFPVLLSVSELRMGEQDLLLGVIRDVSAQKQAADALKILEEQFRQAQRLEAVGRLAGGVAHDFNNILTAITGYTELLLDDFRSNDPRRGDLEEIRAAAQRAAGLTRQLLAFSRKQVLQPRVLDLNEVVRGLEKMLRRLIGEDVSLVFTAGADLGAVKADPGQIEQVLLNLAVNARDAMPKGGRLTVETANVELDGAYAREHADAAPGRYVLMAVSDTGTGMDAETKAHVFEPFFTTKELGKGTGLGLATVHGIVNQSGGRIVLYSEPGRGTTFKIYLPRVDQAPETAAEAETRRGAAAAGHETVLVVEDDRAVREVVAETLAQRGYKVLRAPDGQTALELARGLTDPVHLLLTDIVMPGMTGRELAQALSAERAPVRVLYMSGYTDDAVVRHGVLERGVPYLQKPFTPDALALKVREVLDRR